MKLPGIALSAGLAVASANNADVLQKQADRLEKQLVQIMSEQPHALDDDMCECGQGKDRSIQLLTDWIPKHCGSWGEESSCVGQLQQDIKKVAPYHRSLEISGKYLTKDSIRAFKRQAASQIDEQRSTLSSLKRVIASLNGEDFGVATAELEDRLSLARASEDSPDRSMSLRIFSKSEPEEQCHCFTVTQPRALWDDAEDASTGSGAFLGTSQEFALPDLVVQSTLERLVRAEHRQAEPDLLNRMLAAEGASEASMSAVLKEEDGAFPDQRFMEILEIAGKKYVKKYAGLTWCFLLCTYEGGIAMEPYCDSGPLFPRYTVDSGLCMCAPSSDVYGEGFIWPFAASGDFYYWKSCPFGPFQSKPEMLASIGFNPWGRQWPERTIYSSHPCTSCNADNHENNYFFELWEQKEGAVGTRRLAGAEQNEMLYGSEGIVEKDLGSHLRFFAPDGHMYDARLVEALYDFAEQGVAVEKAALFATTLTQLAVAGLNPKDSNYQHLGLTLEFSKPVNFQNASWRFLTLEMMANGLMWTMTSNVPSKGYDYQKKLTVDYDELSPKVVARFVADHHGQEYKVGVVDCQTFAAQLAQRLSLHGRHLAAAEPAVSTYLIHSADESQTVFETKLRRIFQGDASGLAVDTEAAIASCPEATDAMRVMSDQAKDAWHRCATPLVLTPVTIQAAEKDMQELMNVIEILRDTEKNFFVSHPARSATALMHGPTHLEYKAHHAPQITAWFFVMFAVGIALLGAAVAMLRSLYVRSGLQESSTWQRAKGPFFVLLSQVVLSTPVFSGVVGYYCWKQHKSGKTVSGMDEGAELAANGLE